MVQRRFDQLQLRFNARVTNWPLMVPRPTANVVLDVIEQLTGSADPRPDDVAIVNMISGVLARLQRLRSVVILISLDVILTVRVPMNGVENDVRPIRVNDMIAMIYVCPAREGCGITCDPPWRTS